STTNTPDAREFHTAIWTGSEMIVWGGYFSDVSNHYLNTGGRYDPGTNSWAATSTSDVPSGRYGHTAVWTGSEMIVWGGFFTDESLFLDHYLNTGGRYFPATNGWVATGPPSDRLYHTAVWTGTEMILWGGHGLDDSSDLNTGGRYSPGTDDWTAVTTTNAPSARYYHTAVWTGSEMI